MQNKFYVYILLDPRKPGKYQYRDSMVFDYEPFYVGKGQGRRCEEHFYYKDHPNERCSFKSSKIRKIYRETGLEPIIIKPYENLFEDVSFEVEKFFIKSIGRKELKKGPLTNMTDGGEGNSGLIFSEDHRRKIGQSTHKRNLDPKERLKHSMLGEKNPFYGKKHSKESIEIMRQKKIGKEVSEETRKKLSISGKGKMVGEKNPNWGKKGELSPRFGKSHSEETRKKISEHMKGKMVGEKNPNYGKPLSEGTKEKLRIAMTGRIKTEETRKKLSIAGKGKKRSPESKIRYSAAAKIREAKRAMKKNVAITIRKHLAISA